MKFSQDLRNRRKKLKLTQKDLSSKTGISSNKISDFENDKDTPNEDELNKLQNALNYDFSHKKRKHVVPATINLLTIPILLVFVIVISLPIFTRIMNEGDSIFSYSISIINLNLLQNNSFFKTIIYVFITTAIINVMYSIIITLIIAYSKTENKKRNSILIILNWVLFVINIILFTLIFYNGFSYLNTLKDGK